MTTILIVATAYCLLCYTTNRRALTMGAFNSQQSKGWRCRMAADFLLSPLTVPFKLFL